MAAAKTGGAPRSLPESIGARRASQPSTATSPPESAREEEGILLALFTPQRGGKTMLLTIGIILFIAWILGFFAFHVTAGLIHLLLVLAVVSFVVHLFTGRRSVV